MCQRHDLRSRERPNPKNMGSPQSNQEFACQVRFGWPINENNPTPSITMYLLLTFRGRVVCFCQLLPIDFFMPHIFEPLVRLSFKSTTQHNQPSSHRHSFSLLLFCFSLSIETLVPEPKALRFLSTALCMYVNLFLSLSPIGSLVYAAFMVLCMDLEVTVFIFHISKYPYIFLCLPFSCCLLFQFGFFFSLLWLLGYFRRDSGIRNWDEILCEFVTGLVTLFCANGKLASRCSARPQQ